MDTRAPPPVRDSAAGGAVAPVRRRGLRWALLLAIAAAAIVLLGYLWKQETRPGKTYVTATVDTGPVTPTVIASGTVNPVNTIQVGTYVSGVIRTLSCDFNTRVRAGQLCARLDARPYQSAVDQETANLATANAQLQKDRANLAFAKIIYDRDQELFKRSRWHRRHRSDCAGGKVAHVHLRGRNRRRLRLLRGGRHLLRLLPRAQSGPAQSDRGAAL